MPIILRNVPPGIHWGWHSREDPRMHLQTVYHKDPRQRYKVWLEDKGKRVFQPAGKIPRPILTEIRREVAEYRQGIEDLWVQFMLDNKWLDLHVSLPEITLVAYPNTPNKFNRKLNIANWFKPDVLATLKPEAVALHREMYSLRLWADRPEGLGARSLPHDFRLSTLLWQG